MIELFSRPWPWYVAGPLIGLMVPVLLVFVGKPFGISSSLRHVCAATVPRGIEYFRYNWKQRGAWSLTFALGIFFGGVIAGTLLLNPDPVAISAATRADLAAEGLADFGGLMPADLFSWASLGTVPGFIAIVLGGFLLGFGARYAGGCTSGHGITGLATLQVSSLVAVIGFFIGGLFITHLILPLLL